MVINSLKHSSIGIEKGKTSFKFALVSNHRNLTQILSLQQISNENDFHVKQLDIELNAPIQAAWKDSILSTSIKTSLVLARRLYIPLKKEKEIEAVVKHQAEPLLPYPIEEALVSSLKIETKPEGTDLLLLSVKKDSMEHHLEECALNQIEPEIISCHPVALTAFGLEFCPSNSHLILIHMSESETSCVIIEDDKLQASHSFTMGSQEIYQALAKDLPTTTPESLKEKINQLDFNNLNFQDFPSLVKAIERWLQEAVRITLGARKYSSKTDFTESNEKFLLLGEGILLPQLETALAKKLQIQPLTIEPRDHFSSQELQHFAIPLGAAFSTLPNSKLQVDFRKEKYIYPHPWKRLKTPLLTYAGLMLLMAFLTYFATQLALKKQEDKLRQEYVELIASTHRTPQGFEEEYRTKNKLPSLAQVKEFNPTHLNKGEMLARLTFLDKEIKGTPDVFPLQPNIATVSDFLAWLAQHPRVFADSKGSKETLIKIESLSYALVKRPDHAHKGEKYQVRIDLEFSTATPKEARQFHDALIEPNAMVDPKGEVKWSTSKGKYKTSFFLKDKTSYSSITNGGKK